MMSRIDEVGAWKQIVLLIELFAIFMCLDQVCKRPLTDNLLLLFHLPSFLARMDYVWELIKTWREQNDEAVF